MANKCTTGGQYTKKQQLLINQLYGAIFVDVIVYISNWDILT